MDGRKSAENGEGGDEVRGAGGRMDKLLSSSGAETVCQRQRQHLTKTLARRTVRPGGNGELVGGGEGKAARVATPLGGF